MSKIHLKNDVIGFLEKSLPPFRLKEIEDHLETCDTCRKYVKNFSKVYFSDDNRACPELNPFFYTRVVARLENEPRNESVFPVFVVKSLRPLAAGLFLLTAITFSIFASNFLFPANQLNINSKVSSTNEMTYDYYINNENLFVDQIISNEN